MATTTMTLSAERWLDEVVLRALVADAAIATDIVEGFLSPAGIGDLAIMSVQASAVSIGTVPVTATFDRGARFAINASDDATQVDVVGVAQWFATGGAAAAFDRLDCFIDPDALVLWRQGELLKLSSAELDAGATGDIVVVAKCVRVRPIESPARGPVRLVR